MNEPSSKDLLGFMLGALETDEHHEIETLLEHDPETREELDGIRRQVAALDHLSPPGMPPTGLARRTCERISALASSENIDDIQPASEASAEKSSLRWFSSGREYAGRRRSSLIDFVIVAVVVMLLAAIILPAVNNSRFNSRVLACKNNLRTVGMGLLDYSSNFGGKFIEIPKEGNLGFAGLYAPTLLDSGYVDDSGAFLCAGTDVTSIGKTAGPRFPTLSDLRNAKGRVLRGLQKLAGGDYAYSLGQFVDGRYEVAKNEHRSHFLILADAPSVDRPGRRSGNHSGYGQNGFFEDGHVQFLVDPVVGDDAIYENNWGNIAPGADPDDIVVAPSAVSLYFMNDN